MKRALGLLLLVLAGFAAAQDAPSLEALLARQAAERAQLARVGSRTTTLRELAALRQKHADELRAFVETAPVASRLATQAQAKAAAEDAWALAVDEAAAESQEALVALLDLRLDVSGLALKGPGAFVLDGKDARALGVRWGKVELLLDRRGRVRGVDLVGDERQNLLNELLREVAK